MTTTKEKKRETILMLLCMALVSLLCFHGTMAYLTHKTPEIKNSFALGQGVYVDLQQDQSKNMEFTPGIEYKKPADVLIPAHAMPTEYIAVQIFYYMEEEIPAGEEHAGNLRLVEVTPKQFAHVADLWTEGRKGVKDGWVTKDGTNYYYVNENQGKYTLKPVKAGESCRVFDGYKVRESYGDAYSAQVLPSATLYEKNGNTWKATTTVRTIEHGQLISFHIKVVAYAVQGNIDTAQAVSQFQVMGLEGFPG